MDPQTIFYIVVGVLYLIYNMYRNSQKGKIKRQQELEKARKEHQDRTYKHSEPREEYEAPQEEPKKKHWFEEILEQEFGEASPPPVQEYREDLTREQELAMSEALEEEEDRNNDSYTGLEREPLVRETTQQYYDKKVESRLDPSKLRKGKIEVVEEEVAEVVALKSFDLREAIIQQAILERPFK